MKKVLPIAVATVALAGMLLAGATTAAAVPTRTTACSNCHSPSSSVKIKITKVSSTSSAVTYKVAVTGGSGTAGWAVLSGGKNLAHKVASTGTFKVAKGKTIKVYGVKKGTGSARKTLTVK
jgi:hypothetical protein